MSKSSRTALAAAFLLLLGAPASAQQPSAITEQFRAYRAALERQDFVAAETAAASALQASEQRDGDGGRTAVLALNLTTARLMLGMVAEAEEPARRAYELAQSHADSGVDPLIARLVLGRIQFARDGSAGLGFLRSALEDAEGRSDLADYSYGAAEQLGLWSMSVRRYDAARDAWALAANTAEASGIDPQFARGRAKTYEGIAIALQSLTRDVTMPTSMATDALTAFAEARPLLYPFAVLDAQDGQLTAPQELYAQALAWSGAIWSQQSADDRHPPMRLDPGQVRLPDDGECQLSILERPRPNYPRRTENEGQVASVVVRLRFNELGQSSGGDLAASVGDEAFARAVAVAATRWTYALDLNNPVGCRPSAVQFVHVMFMFGY